MPSSPAPLDAVAKFDELLDTSFRSHRYKSFSHFLEAIKGTVKTHETDAFEKLSVLDLGSHPENISPESIFSEAIPEASVYSKGKNPNDRGLNIEVLKPDMPRLTSVEHKSVDMVTCAFGFPYMEDPNAVMSHVHRVLKPGGSLVAASWDSISLEHIANHILSEIIGKPPVNIHFLDLNHPFNGPHYLEKLAEHGGLSIVKSEHFEFPFVLTEDGIVHDDAFDFAILPIRHILKNLEETGSHPNARSEAREIFDQMIEKGELFSIDDHGCLITDANRFNVVVARRLFEDSDGIWTME